MTISQVQARVQLQVALVKKEKMLVNLQTLAKLTLSNFSNLSSIKTLKREKAPY